MSQSVCLPLSRLGHPREPGVALWQVQVVELLQVPPDAARSQVPGLAQVAEVVTARLAAVHPLRRRGGAVLRVRLEFRSRGQTDRRSDTASQRDGTYVRNMVKREGLTVIKGTEQLMVRGKRHGEKNAGTNN